MSGTITRSFQNFMISQQLIHLITESLFIRYGKTSSHFDQVACFLEFLVSGSEYDRYAIHRSFQCIMYTGSETSTDISDRAVTVDRREQSETIDDQAIFPVKTDLASHPINGQRDASTATRYTSDVPGGSHAAQ